MKRADFSRPGSREIISRSCTRNGSAPLVNHPPVGPSERWYRSRIKIRYNNQLSLRPFEPKVRVATEHVATRTQMMISAVPSGRR